jgi:membrane fusion protein, multidrug efflux system
MVLALGKRRLILYIIVIAGLLVGGFLAFQFTEQKPLVRQAAGPVVVETAVVVATPLQDAVTALGSLQAAESVMIKAEVAGRIARINFKDGAKVSMGQELIGFDAAIQQALLSQARAERDLAQARLLRTQDLFNKKFLSAAALDDAKASEQVAQARLAFAQASLDKMSLRAPFDGVMGIRQVSVGDYIKEGVDLVNLEDTRSMKVDFRVPEQISSRLRVGQTVNLQSDALPGQTFPATVVALDSAIDTGGRSLLVRAELKDASQRLRPGMFVRVRLILETRDQALVIPEEAIVTAQGSLLVVKVVDGKASRVQVETGLRTTLNQRAVVEVTKGLSAGDTVVTAGQIKIRENNTPVTALPPLAVPAAQNGRPALAPAVTPAAPTAPASPSTPAAPATPAAR